MSEQNPAASAAQVDATNSVELPATQGQTEQSYGESDVQEILNEGKEAKPKTETAEQKEVKKQVEALKKKLKLKVNGKEIEKEIDFNNEDDLRSAYQKALAAEQTWEEAAKIKKQMRMIGEALEADPFELMRQMGKDPDKLAQEYMEKRIKDFEKSPEQRRVEELQKEVEQERKRREDLENEKLQLQEQKIQEEYMRDLDEQIGVALKETDLPPQSPYVVNRIIQYLSIGLEQGKQLSVKDVVPLVEKSIKKEIRQMFEVAPEDMIEKMMESYIGNDILSKARKKRLAKMKEVPSVNQVKPTGQAEMEKALAQAKPKEKINPKDFWKKLR
jgi:hypothetical protein